MGDFEKYYKIRKIGEDLFSLILRIRQLDDFELKTLLDSLELTVNELVCEYGKGDTK